MRKPRASNEKARERAGLGPQFAHGYEVNWDGTCIIIYDDVEAANGLAEGFGTYVKHAKSKFDNPYWTTFSLVRLPGT